MATIKPNLFSPNNIDNFRKGQVIEYQSPEFKNDLTFQKIIQCIKENEPDNDKIVIGNRTFEFKFKPNGKHEEETLKNKSYNIIAQTYTITENRVLRNIILPNCSHIHIFAITLKK